MARRFLDVLGPHLGAVDLLGARRQVVANPWTCMCTKGRRLCFMSRRAYTEDELRQAPRIRRERHEGAFEGPKRSKSRPL